ncbi:hypothetical protein [uncultured Tateyamaria sp.]|uniref:hypothetical protein n=1 Tax=uncultured Tateyamaria sp. TaxID=455651 RepID=UPI002604605C|nr:hypothetical protein [uncultured Tateyamaria sp.]
MTNDFQNCPTNTAANGDRPTRNVRDDVSALNAPSRPIGIGHHEPENVAMAAKFLCGDATARMTVKVLDVSCSQNARNIG